MLVVGIDRCAVWLFRSRAQVRLLGRLFGAIALVLLLGNAIQIRRFEYLSFETLANARVVSMKRVALDGLYLGPTAATEYALSRDGYELRIHIDAGAFFPHATVKLSRAPEGTLLQPRLARPDTAPSGSTRFAQPCGTISTPQGLNPDGTRVGSSGYTLLWIGCADRVLPGQSVMAFDVIDPSGNVAEENLRFEVKRRGFFVRPARFDGGILLWGEPISTSSLHRGDSGLSTLLRLAFGSPVY